jgi:predicted nucleic acid-binding protein
MSARFVVDTSVVMAWCFQDAGNRYADAVLESLETSEACAPAIWPLEVGNVLLVAERKRRLSEASLVRFLALLRSLPITVEQEAPDRILTEIISLARTHHLSTYDASYLDLAMRLELPIATQDAQLVKAAQTCRVPAFDPAAAQGAS